MQLGAATAPVGGATVTLFTVPAGQRMVLRSVTMRNLSTSSGTGWVVFNGSGMFIKPLTPAGTDGASFEYRPWVVFGPGATLGISAGSGIAVFMVASGSIYTI